jgi:general secretion pathway protein F
MRYQVKGFKESEGLVVREFEASTKDLALRAATAQGITVISAYSRSGKSFSFLSSKLDLTAFSRELAALLQAGLVLVESIETLGEKEQRALVKQTLEQLRQDLYGGSTFSSALEKFPGIFPPLYVATVRSSEQTGDLAEALNRYVSYQAQINLVRNKLVAASVYPLLLLFFGALVTVFLLAYVVPKFSHIYEDHAHNLPFLSSLLMQWGGLIASRGIVVALWALGALTLVGYGLSRPVVRAKLVARFAKIPVIAERVRIYHLARFYRTLGMLLRGGTAMMNALQMAEGLLRHARLQEGLRQATLAISQGQPLSRALHQNGLTTPVALRMLVVGERSGSMPRMTEQIAAFYDEEMAHWVEMFTRLFEPLLMAFIGLIIGGIVVLMYFPIFELAGNIQ